MYATAQDIATVFEAITALANAQPYRDGRNLGQRRSDALTDLAAAVLAGGGTTDVLLPARRGRIPHLLITLPASVLTGGSAPCELAGHGPITAAQTRDVIDRYGATYHRLLTDPETGDLLDYGRTRYQPPAHLADFVAARDRTCSFPGCTQPAHACDLDHITPYSRGGTTSTINLTPQCRHHHRGKDGGGHHLTRDPDGTIHWTTPLGRTYTHHPEPLPTDPLAAHPAPADPLLDDETDWDDHFRTDQQPEIRSGPGAATHGPNAEPPSTDPDDDPPPF